MLIMGCVLGKRASGRRRTPKNDQRREPESAAGTVQNDAVERENERKIEVVGGRRGLPAEFRLITGAAADRWPSWLVDVAGDAIKEWKPRRANTFEKLDKVIPV